MVQQAQLFPDPVFPLLICPASSQQEYVPDKQTDEQENGWYRIVEG
jgi:hypothetical protein